MIRRSLFLRFLVLLSVLPAAITFAQQTKNSTGVQIPPPGSPTIPMDAMFALGQQSGRLDGIDKRLGSIEVDVKDIGRDVSRINFIAWVFGAALTLIIAPIVVTQVNRWINTRTPITPV